MKIYIHGIIIFLLPFNIELFAKSQFFEKFKENYNLKRYDSLIILTDEAIKNEHTKNNPKTWYYRGFVFKELYTNVIKADGISKKNTGKDTIWFETKNIVNSEFREKAINCFLKGLSLSPDEILRIEMQKNLRYLSATIYNDGAITLEKNYLSALKLFDQYKQINKLIDPKMDFSEMEKSINNALVGLFIDRFRKNPQSDSIFYFRADSLIQNLIKTDSQNVFAQRNLAVLYNLKNGSLKSAMDDLKIKNEISNLEIKNQKLLRNSFITGFAFLLLFGLAILTSLIKVRNANKLLAAQKREIEEKNKEITDSIKYASRIQRALITPEKYIALHLNKLIK